jgi:hypothetical protein
LEVAALTHVTRISVRFLASSMFNCAKPAFTQEAEKEKIGFAATTVDNQPGHAGQESDTKYARSRVKQDGPKYEE